MNYKKAEYQIYNGETFGDIHSFEKAEIDALARECNPMDSYFVRLCTFDNVFMISLPDEPYFKSMASALARRLNLDTNPFLLSGTYVNMSNTLMTPKFVRVSSRVIPRTVNADDGLCDLLKELGRSLDIDEGYSFLRSIPLVYIAGPDVFSPNAEKIAEEKKRFIAKHGAFPLYPLDNDSDDPEIIALANYQMIDNADFVIADMNPFRGDEPDSGTCAEVGYALAKGKIVVAYLKDARSQVLRLGLTDKNGYAVENFQSPLNIMFSHHPNFYYVKGGFEDAVEKSIKLSNKEKK